MGDFSILAIRIKELRTSMKMTQKEFSAFVGCTAATLSAYENGSKSPSLEIIKGIAEKCHISIDWLCGLSAEKTIKPKTYKDVALKILELLDINTYPYYPYWTKSRINGTDMQVIVIPQKAELLKFMETYGDLNSLLNSDKIKQHVIDTWLEGALEELNSIPLDNSDELPLN